MQRRFILLGVGLKCKIQLVSNDFATKQKLNVLCQSKRHSNVSNFTWHLRASCFLARLLKSLCYHGPGSWVWGGLGLPRHFCSRARGKAASSAPAPFAQERLAARAPKIWSLYLKTTFLTRLQQWLYQFCSPNRALYIQIFQMDTSTLSLILFASKYYIRSCQHQTNIFQFSCSTAN